MVFDWISFGEPLSFWQMLLRIVAAVVFGAIIGIFYYCAFLERAD